MVDFRLSSAKPCTNKLEFVELGQMMGNYAEIISKTHPKWWTSSGVWPNDVGEDDRPDSLSMVENAGFF